jgi:hypothetical protein
VLVDDFGRRKIKDLLHALKLKRTEAALNLRSNGPAFTSIQACTNDNRVEHYPFCCVCTLPRSEERRSQHSESLGRLLNAIIHVRKVAQGHIHQSSQVAEKIGEGHAGAFNGIDDDGGEVDEVIFTREFFSCGRVPIAWGKSSIPTHRSLSGKKHKLGFGFFAILALVHIHGKTNEVRAKSSHVEAEVGA